MNSATLYTNSVARLVQLFHENLTDLGHFTPVQAEDLPHDARVLLAHNDHMTVTLEAFHNSLVDVHVLEQTHDESSYSREILLTRQRDDRVVLYGIMRIWLTDLPSEARQEIMAGGVPLGRVLIRHSVLRDVELMTLWQIKPTKYLRDHLNVPPGEGLYGRTAQILVDERPTVQLLEIVRS
jgi:chorismate-pyruvate lyase